MIAPVLLLAAGMLQQTWYTYEPDGKNFRVELPNKPNSTSSRASSSAAGRSQVTTAQLRMADATYTIQLTESPARINPQTLDDGIQRFAASSNATLGDIATITVDDQPGREFEMTERSAEGQKISKMRWIATGNALLMLTVASKPGSKLTPDADRFLGSLEFGARKAVANARPKASAGAPAQAGINTPPRAAGGVAAKPGVNPQARPGSSTRAMARDTAPPKTSDSAQGGGDFVPGETPAKGEGTDDDNAKGDDTKPARKLYTLSKITAKAIPRTMKLYAEEELEDLPRSFLAQDRGGGFRDIGPAGSVLVGVRVSFIDRFGGSKIRSIQPIYRLGATNYLGRVYGQYVPPFATFVAMPGYAVGGIVSRAGLMVDGFGLVFMKVDGDHLEPGETYNSPWIGDKTGGRAEGATSQGNLVVGLQGRAEKEVRGLGLTTQR
jgi:hypothetical protein